MKTTGDRIRALRKKLGMTQEFVAKQLGMGRSNFGHIENNRVSPTSEDINKLADILRTNTDYLLGRSDDPTSDKHDPYTLTPKDEKDIAVELERLMDSLAGDHALSFLGEPIDDEDRELLRISLENSLRLSKQLAKKKFTPKKYRK